MRIKEAELKKCASIPSPNQLDVDKHRAIQNLLLQLDAAINHFNDAPTPSTPDEETTNIAVLTKNFLKSINKTIADDGSTLIKPRNNHREMANNIVHYSILTGAFAAKIAFSSFSIVGGLATVWWAGFASNIGRYAAGLSDLTPASARLVGKLGIETLNIIKDLNISLKDESLNQKKSAKLV